MTTSTSSYGQILTINGTQIPLSGPTGSPVIPANQIHVFNSHAGMQHAVVCEGDWPTHGKTCPQCGNGFEAGEEILESWDQSVHIHVNCVRVMYERLPDTPERVDAEFERRREELLGCRTPG